VKVTHAATKPQPNTCDLSIKNLSDDHRKQIEQSTVPGAAKTKVPLVLSAGYRGRQSVIFSGELRSGHSVPSGSTLVTELTTGDGDDALTQTRLSIALSRGSTAEQGMRKILEALGVGEGNLAEGIARIKQQALAAQLFSRGVVLKGAAAELMTHFCRSVGLEWSIQNGALQLTALGQPIGGQAVAIDADHGMLGSPTVDTEGHPLGEDGDAPRHRARRRDRRQCAHGERRLPRPVGRDARRHGGLRLGPRHRGGEVLMPRSQVRLGEIFDAVAGGVMGDVHKVMPGIVVAYHPSSAPTGGSPGAPARVDVQPAVHDVRQDTGTGDRVSEPWQVLPEVPVAFPRGGGFSLRWKLAPGDKVTLVSFDLDPTAHFGTGQAEDPPDVRRHGGGYWLALPYDLTDGGALEDPGDDLVVTLPGGNEIRANATAIALGHSPSDFVALASLVAAELAKITLTLTPMVTAFNAPVAPMVSLGPGVVPPYVAGSVAAVVVKAK
jgi:hypothetical protein